MSERRRALGRGLGALIPSGPAGTGATQRPVDVFFQDREGKVTEPQSTQTTSGTSPASSSISPEAAAESGSSAASAPSPTGPTVPLSASEALLAELEEPQNGTATEATEPGSPVSPRTSTDAASTAAPTDAALPSAPSTSAAAPAADTPASTAADPSADDVAKDDEGLRPVPGATFAEVPVTAVHRNAKQPRQVFDDDELNELASSIREVGVLQPVVVRPSGTDADGDTTYELIMGERRWRACRIAGNTTVPAIIRETAEQDMLRDALLENLHRAQLNPLEEAAAYQQLLDDFDCTHDELAVRIARSRPQISNTLRLLKLPPLVQRRVAAGVLSAGHARALLGLNDGAAMERLAQRIVAEGLSVRATEEIVTLGDDPVHPEMRRRPRAGAHSAALNDLAARLSDNLDTKVNVNLGQRKGRVTIDFASVQDLNRILGVLMPTDPGVLRDVEDAAVTAAGNKDTEGAVEAED